MSYKILFAFLGEPFLNASRKLRRKKALNFFCVLNRSPSHTSQFRTREQWTAEQDPKIPRSLQISIPLSFESRILPIFQNISTHECEMGRRIRSGLSQTATEMMQVLIFELTSCGLHPVRETHRSGPIYGNIALRPFVGQYST